jgi:hypothetical protein
MPCSIVGSYQSNGVVHPRRECYLIKAQRRLSAALHMCPLRHGSLREFRGCTSCPFHRNQMIAHQKNPVLHSSTHRQSLYPSQSTSSQSSSFKNPPFRFSHLHHIFHDPSPVPSRASPRLASIPITGKSLLRNNAWQPKSQNSLPPVSSHSTFRQLQRRRASCNYPCLSQSLLNLPLGWRSTMNACLVPSLSNLLGQPCRLRPPSSTCLSPRSAVLMLANASQCHLCDPTLLEARP